jgi:N-acyl-D-aspartate/D-glutamate deacylase
VPWNWRSSAEYLDRVDGTPSVNIGFLVGHSALRRVVLGPDSTEREATSEEIRHMCDLLAQGLHAGGLGFSSTRSNTHSDMEGRPAPSRLASKDEFIALAGVCSEFEGTSVETSPVASTSYLGEDDIELMVRMSLAARSPVNWNAMTVTEGEIATCRRNLEAGSIADNRGGRVVAMTIPMPVAARYSFVTGVFLDALPGWDEFMRLPLLDRIAKLEDPVERSRLNAMAQQPGPRRQQAEWSELTVLEGFTPESKAYENQTVGEIAMREHRDPFDVLSEIVVADRLHTGLGRIPGPPSARDWEAKLEVWRDGRAVIGASDAGAHLDVLAIFNYPTWLLQEVVRVQHLMELEEAIKLLTSVPAELYGLVDRGTIVRGAWADIVLFDPETIGTQALYTRNDLPGGSGRLYAAADGIHRVLVAGQTIVEDGTVTSARPGRVLRRGLDTRSPELRVPKL